MRNKVKIFWILSAIAFVFGLIWGFAMTADLAFVGFSLHEIVFVILGLITFVMHAVLEKLFDTDAPLGILGGIFLFGVMVLGSVVTAFNFPGLVLGVLSVGIPLIFEVYLMK